jgi:hypothetical protein
MNTVSTHSQSQQRNSLVSTPSARTQVVVATIGIQQREQ